MAEETEDWIFDSVVGFLCSPLWKTPILNFIEQNCLVFDTEEENKFSYTAIHQNYAKLVESLLESYLEDLGITAEQFASVCSPEEDGRTHDSFEHVTAASDFEVFKRMMVERNIELELEALSVLQKKLGYRVLKGGEAGVFDQQSEVKRIEEEEKLLREVLSRSAAEHEAQERQYEDDLARALAESARMSTKSPKKIEKEGLASLGSLPGLTPAKIPSSSGKALTSGGDKELSSRLPSVRSADHGNGDAARQWLTEAKREVSASGGKDDKDESGVSRARMSSKDIEMRQAYLKARRDQLAAAKKGRQGKRSDDVVAIESLPEAPTQTKTTKGEENLRSLMKKLKEEVVYAKK